MNTNAKKEQTKTTTETIQGNDKENNTEEKTQELSARLWPNSTRKPKQKNLDRALLVRMAIRSGYSIKEVCDYFKISETTVHRIISIRSNKLAAAFDQLGQLKPDKTKGRVSARVAQTLRDAGFSASRVGKALHSSKSWAQQLWHRPPCKRCPLVAIQLDQTILDTNGTKIGSGRVWVQSVAAEGMVLVYRQIDGMPVFVSQATMRAASKRTNGEYVFPEPKEIGPTARAIGGAA